MIITEQESHYHNLEQMSTLELISGINTEDEKIAQAVRAAIPQITKLIDAAFACMIRGGRLIYIGAGTSGRLGVLDASECPPTFGVSPDLVLALIAGGDQALRNAIENAEDDGAAGRNVMKELQLQENDFVTGISASGYTSFVNEAMSYCDEKGIETGCITCNPETPLSKISKYPVEVITGPEFITGSTRMKAGTAQKMVLNMISTSLMIKLGHVEGNKMIHLMPANEKLRERSINIIMEKTGIIDRLQIEALLKQYGTIPAVLKNL